MLKLLRMDIYLIICQICFLVKIKTLMQVLKLLSDLSYNIFCIFLVFLRNQYFMLIHKLLVHPGICRTPRFIPLPIPKSCPPSLCTLCLYLIPASFRASRIFPHIAISYPIYTDSILFNMIRSSFRSSKSHQRNPFPRSPMQPVKVSFQVHSCKSILPECLI